MNKNQPRPADGGAEEGKKNKDWDPNAGLPGRLPPKPQADASEPTDASAPAAPAAANAPAAPAPVVAPATPKSTDALGDLARSRSEAAKPAEPASRPAAEAADPFQYFLQVGAFRNPEEAEQLRAKLLLQGLQAKVSEREQGGRVVHRVRLGPFERRDEAEKARDRLEGGSSAVVVRVQR